MRRRTASTAWLLLGLLLGVTVLAVLLAALDPSTAPVPRRPVQTTTGGGR